MPARGARFTKDDPLVQAFRPGQITPDTQAEIEAHRAMLAERRASRAPSESPIQARNHDALFPADRRSGERRQADRRFATMQDKLDDEAAKAALRRFTGAPVTDFSKL